VVPRGEIHPELRAANWHMAGEYSSATVRAAPVEFGWETARRVGRDRWFLLVALGWFVAAAWTRHPTAQVFCLLSLLGVDDLWMTEMGGYEYMDRLQAPSFPIRLVVLMHSAACTERGGAVRSVMRRRASGGSSQGSRPSDVTVRPSH
jgi:hypothetical protein